MDRHKNGKENFYDLVNGDETFTDLAFPTNDAHYFADGGSNETEIGMDVHAELDTWHRVSEGGHFTEGMSLFGDNYIQPRDIEQGELGNCWVLSSLTAMAEYEGRIEKIFLNKTLSKNGVYGVQMYALGVPVTVMVDDYLPLRSWGLG
jgi:hypothetical protein